MPVENLVAEVSELMGAPHEDVKINEADEVAAFLFEDREPVRVIFLRRFAMSRYQLQELRSGALTRQTLGRAGRRNADRPDAGSLTLLSRWSAPR